MNGLGKRFEFTNLSYKPYPCCRFNHTAIDAALDIRKQLGGDVSGIRKISALVNKQGYEAVCTPPDIRKSPKTVVQAQFSIPYTVACALIKGAVKLTDFTSDSIKDPAVHTLAAKVEPRVDDDIEREWSRNVSPTHLVVETASGTFEARMNVPRGDRDAPMTTADFDQKMGDCLDIGGLKWSGSTVDGLRENIASLEKAPSVAGLISALAPPGN